ncbi:hypothetical protein FXO37_21480 [Capsicum annuum]|nr:hypothetical protein FXO37_21480 [Capsicum annuum]
MTGFNDCETPYPCLEIVENKSDSHAKALTLKVHPPVIGAFSLVRKPLETSLHLTEWSTTEIKDVMDNFSGKIMTAKVLLLKSSTYQNCVVASSPSRNEALAVGVSLSLASGRFDIYPTTGKENAPFVELGMEESLRDETYLAAFLACWICKFLLPNKKAGCIRASVFKVASLMAHREKFSLAVPVLASIYRGLWEISTSSNLVSCHALFPIHYVYGWIGKEVQIDNSGKLPNSWSDFFIGLRSSFVTLRHDDDLVVDPYSPHRFSRQFRFCHGILKKHYFDGSLLALVQLWDSCVRLGSLSNLNIPIRPLDN